MSCILSRDRDTCAIARSIDCSECSGYYDKPVEQACMIGKAPDSCGIVRIGKECDHCPGSTTYTPMSISEYKLSVEIPDPLPVIECDARVTTGLMTLCEFAGNKYDPDKRRKCKHYKQHSSLKSCRYYREMFMGACDCTADK